MEDDPIIKKGTKSIGFYNHEIIKNMLEKERKTKERLKKNYKD